MRLRRPGRLRTWAALMGTAAVLAAGCAAPEEVVVVIVTTPGTNQAQVTVAPSSDPATAAPSASAPTTQSSLSLNGAIRIASSPKFDSKDVGPNEPFTVTVFAGTIADLAVETSDGVPVEGGLDKKKATWTAKERLEYGTKYVVKGTAVASDGSTKPISGSISTVNPSSTVRASFQRPIANGETVGVAAPIILTFFEAIQDKAEAQRALKVTTDKGEIEGTWGWLQDEDVQGNGQPYSIAHFRPKEYWPANTEVHVEANLRGVDYGNAWGREDIAADFKIGRSQIVKADVASMRMIVIRDGSVVENYPVSYGKEAEPGRNTVSGIHVVTEKYPEFKMCNPQWGYCNIPEKWAVRINNNGEFIHHNAETEKRGLLGVANVSHGCINMGGADAEEYYRSALYGDPVEVTGTGVPMTEADAIYDWKYSWADWKKLSRLSS